MSRGTNLLIVLAGLAGGCLDSLGHEEDVSETRGTTGISRLEDDRIEDKTPVYDPGRVVPETFGPNGSSCSVFVNKSAAVTKLDVVPFEGGESRWDGKLFHARTEALAAVAAVPDADPIPSMEVVNGALKPFNDGLYAAVELDAEADKRALLSGLQARLTAGLSTADATTRSAFEAGAALVGAATILGGDTPTLDAALAAQASSTAAAFQAQPQFARPIGFYTWSPALERIFTRDRFLQNGDDSTSDAAFAALAYVLGQDADLLAQYQRITALYAGLTNPFGSYPLDALIPYVPTAAALAAPDAVFGAFAQANPTRQACGGPLLAFLPASRSKEVDFFDSSYCDGVPPGTNLLDAFIDAIRNGVVDLATDASSGWYDYQEYALETLLLPERGPESQHLVLTAGYKRKLLETFKSILIQTRETHVKQLTPARAASVEIAPVDIYPLLPAEPFPTYYLRTARGYRFLKTFLEAARGTALLSSEARLLETGERAAAPLGDELDSRIGRLYGLAFLTADAVGMARTEGLFPDELAEIDPDAAVAAARTWLGGWRTDPDVARDPRVIVPIRYGEDGITTYWAVVGVKALVARAEFVAGHEPVVAPTWCWTGKLVPHRYTLLVEDTAELRLPSTTPPPTRAELRAICDANASKDAIVAALGGL